MGIIHYTDEQKKINKKKQEARRLAAHLRKSERLKRLGEPIGFTFSEIQMLQKSDQDKYSNFIIKKILKLCPHIFNIFDIKNGSAIAVIIADGDEDGDNLVYHGGPSEKFEDFCYIYKLSWEWKNCYSANIWFK